MRQFSSGIAFLIAVVGAVLALTVPGNTVPVVALIVAFVLLALHAMILMFRPDRSSNSRTVTVTGPEVDWTGTSETANRSSSLAALAMLSRTALEGGDLTSLTDQVIRLTRHEFDADAVEIHRLTEGLLLPHSGTTTSQKSGDSSLIGQAVLQQRGLLDVDDSAPVPLAAAGATSARGAAMMVGAGTNPYGTLSIRTAHRVYSPEDLTFLQLVADTFALAVERQGASADATWRARYDTLTGLPNQALFLDKVANVLEVSTRAPKLSAVYILDLDNFSVVNDSVGHATGDLLLELLANRLQAAVRPGDLLARFGGDEFTLLAEGIDDEAHAMVIADRLRGSLHEPFPVGDHEVIVTASVGLALTDSPDIDAGTLLQQADAAMVAAKASGRDASRIFDQSMVDSAMARLRTESELREALDTGQLRVFYQPVVDLESGQTVSCEALVRWLHPGRGLVTPDEFIPISEETALVEEISNWVLGEAAQQAATWAAEGRPMQISVNLAARQITNPALPHQVAAVLERTGLKPSLLCLEITEHKLVDDLNTAAKVIGDLQRMNVVVAVDDFGTGYSSLAYLRKLPIDVIKIDRDFIHGLTSSGEDYSITKAVISLAGALGKVVVAEGVETEGQLTVLRELGCDQAQGYLFSPAVIPTPEHEPTPEWSELVLGRSH